MVLESIMICVDDSKFMKNDDHPPSRLHAQENAVQLISHIKAQYYPDIDVGLLSLSKAKILSEFTSNTRHIFAIMRELEPDGNLQLEFSIRVALLALKHRHNQHYKQRIIVFVGSPIQDNKNKLTTLIQELKEEGVCVDFINFEEQNNDILSDIIETLNGEDGFCSHLVSFTKGDNIEEVLISSPLLHKDFDDYQDGVDLRENHEVKQALKLYVMEQAKKNGSKKNPYLQDVNQNDSYWSGADKTAFVIEVPDSSTSEEADSDSDDLLFLQLSKESVTRHDQDEFVCGTQSKRSKLRFANYIHCSDWPKEETDNKMNQGVLKSILKNKSDVILVDEEEYMPLDYDVPPHLVSFSLAVDEEPILVDVEIPQEEIYVDTSHFLAIKEIDKFLPAVDGDEISADQDKSCTSEIDEKKDADNFSHIEDLKTDIENETIIVVAQELDDNDHARPEINATCEFEIQMDDIQDQPGTSKPQEFIDNANSHPQEEIPTGEKPEIRTEITTDEKPEIHTEIATDEKPEIHIDITTDEKPKTYIDITTDEKPEIHTDITTRDVDITQDKPEELFVDTKNDTNIDQQNIPSDVTTDALDVKPKPAICAALRKVMEQKEANVEFQKPGEEKLPKEKEDVRKGKTKCDNRPKKQSNGCNRNKIG